MPDCYVWNGGAVGCSAAGDLRGARYDRSSQPAAAGSGVTGVPRTLVPIRALRLPLFRERQVLQMCRVWSPKLPLVMLRRLRITALRRRLSPYNRSACRVLLMSRLRLWVCRRLVVLVVPVAPSRRYRTLVVAEMVVTTSLVMMSATTLLVTRYFCDGGTLYMYRLPLRDGRPVQNLYGHLCGTVAWCAGPRRPETPSNEHRDELHRLVRGRSCERMRAGHVSVRNCYT